MKNILLYLSSVLIFAMNSYSQPEIEFINKYVNGKEYHQQTTTTSDSEVKYSGSKKILKYLKSQNIENPQKTSEESVLEIIYRIGSKEENISKLEIEYVETGNTKEDAILKKGDKIYGTIDDKNKIELTDLSNDSIYGEEKAQLLSIFEYGFAIDIFNGKTMKIGDTLVKNNSMKIPISENVLDLAIINVYQLKKIKNGIAYFDITQKTSFNSDLTEISLSAKGNGKGKCEYDIKQMHILKSESALNLRMFLKMDKGIEITVNLKSITSSNTTIKN
ncbi:MAG: hypothetical protein PHQ74_07220 [Crocinitomicaceae bacterium]|nr:hypothetical protein [Crocinitomicaceae bacterium]